MEVSTIVTFLVGGTGLAGIIGSALAAWASVRTKKVEVEAPDWPAFAQRLEAQVSAQDGKIADLYRLVGELRSELDGEQHRSFVIMRYLRTVLVWALELLPPGARIPPPPSEISDEVRDLTGGGDET